MVRRLGRTAVLLVLALGTSACAVDPGATPAPTAPGTTAPEVAATTEPEPGATSESEAGAASEPVPPVATTSAALTPSQLDIPAIGLSTTLIGLGINDDGTVEVPQDPARAGWFDLGTLPGQGGSAVILGHVDSLTGPAVFADLDALSKGDEISVALSDATVVRFEVRRVATFANADFPAQRVYAGTPGRVALNLVTCGGDYDRDRGGYQANVVVFSERIS